MSPSKNEEPVKEIIAEYTREQAVKDGMQIAVDQKASKEARIRYPIFITKAVWDQFVTVPPKVLVQNEAGRLWDILWMLRSAMNQGGQAIFFTVWIRNDNHSSKPRKLKAVCGPLDRNKPEPAITIMLPEED